MIRVVTESTADIPQAMADELGIEVVPTYVVFGTMAYRDGLDLTREQFYHKLGQSGSLPTTATPPPGVYETVYRRLSGEGHKVVSIHTASRFSGLFGAASLAAANVAEASIAMVDSDQVSMGCGWMAVAAAEAARRGETLERILQMVQGMKRRTSVLAVLDTLEFLRRGGRVGWVSAMIGALVQVKPLIEVRMGEVKLLERTRSWKRALERLLAQFQSLGMMERAIVLHANAIDAAERVADQVQALHPEWKRCVGQAGATIASHVGPGAVGLACVARAR